MTDLKNSIDFDNLTLDPDHDGLTTAQEINIGTNPFVADTDGDYVLDGREIMDGTNPLQDEIRQIVRTAVEAIERYGRGVGDEKTFNNSHYQIQQKSAFETYGWQYYLTLTAKDERGRVLAIKGDNASPDRIDVLENRLTEQDVKAFEKIQEALDYLQQIRQLFQDAQTLFWGYRHKDPQQPQKGYGTLEGEKYQLTFDEQAFKIIAKDGRGEIFTYPSDRYTPHPEIKALANLTAHVKK